MFSTDTFAKNTKGYVYVYSPTTKKEIKFKAFITEYSDTFTVNYNSEEVYGRMDPIQIYKRTNREIQLGWDVIAESEEEAYDNLVKVQDFIQMLYPKYKILSYKSAGKLPNLEVPVLSSPPLLRIKFMSLVSKNMQVSREAEKNGRKKENVYRYKISNDGTAKDDGLLVTPASFSFSPNFGEQMGLYNMPGKDKKAAKGFYLPITYQMSSQFQVLHEHLVGHPYENNPSKTSPKAPSAKKTVNKINNASSRTKGLEQLNYPYGLKGK